MINAQVIAAGSRTLLCVREHWKEKLQSQKIILLAFLAISYLVMGSVEHYMYYIKVNKLYQSSIKLVGLFLTHLNWQIAG